MILLGFVVGGCKRKLAPTITLAAPDPTSVRSTAISVLHTDTAAPPTPIPVPPKSTPVPPAATSLPPTATPVLSTPVPPMEITSGGFEPGGEIPEKCSCFGENLSPPLEWVGVPDGTQSLALLVDDPDSQPSGFVHWGAYNIPPDATGMPEGLPAGPVLPDGALQGPNDFPQYGRGTFPGGAAIKLVGYDGPCPGGRHRYLFMLDALDAVLDLNEGLSRGEVLEALEGHILDQAELVGVFAPPGHSIRL